MPLSRPTSVPCSQHKKTTQFPIVLAQVSDVNTAKGLQFLLASMRASLSKCACSCPRLAVDTGQASAPQLFWRMNRNVLQLKKKRRNETGGGGRARVGVGNKRESNEISHARGLPCSRGRVDGTHSRHEAGRSRRPGMKYRSRLPFVPIRASQQYRQHTGHRHYLV